MKKSWILVALAIQFGHLLSVGKVVADELDHTPNVATELCASPGGFPGILNGNTNDPFPVNPHYLNQQAQARASMSDAYAMWVRDGIWNKTIALNATCASRPETPAGGWFDRSEEQFESWYELRSTVIATAGDPNAVGVTGYDWAFPSNDWILAADIMVASDFSYQIINQDNMADYFESGNSLEQVWLHEIGHSYGLDHVDATINVMEPALGNHRNANIVAAYSEFPWPSDIYEMRSRYETPGTRTNLSASVWSRDPSTGSETITSPALYSIGASGSQNYIFSYSVEKFYFGLLSSFGVRFYAVPGTASPTFSTSTQQWTFPAGSVNVGSSFTSNVAEQALKRLYTFTVWGSTLSVGTYRIWMMVDPTFATTETDETDNAIPTAIQVQRI